MAETATETPPADQVRDALTNADAPMTTGEVCEATGRSSRSDIRRVLEGMGAHSRTLATPGAGRKPEAWALSAAVLAAPHPAESASSTARPAARKTARKTTAPGKARKVAANAKKRTSTRRATKATRATAAPARKRTSSARVKPEHYETTPYFAEDGAPIVSKDGHLFVVRPLVEQS